MDYQREFFNLIKETEIVNEKDIYFAQVGNGNEPGVINAKTISSYEPTNNWVTYNFNTSDTYWTRKGYGLADITLTIEIIGATADFLATQLKGKLSTTKLLTYMKKHGLTLYNADVTAQDGNFLNNSKWYRRRILEFKFNSKVEIETQDDYVDNIELQYIKEV